MTQIYGSRLTDANTSPTDPLGAVREYQDPTYGLQRFKYVRTADALAIGYTLRFKLTGSSSAPGTWVGKTGGINRPAGVALGSAAANAYVWVQTYGLNVKIKTDEGVASGDELVCETASTVVDTYVGGTNSGVPIGFSVQDDSGSNLTLAFLTIS